MDGGLTGSSVHGILHVRILELLSCPSPGDLRPRDWTHVSYVSCIGKHVLYLQCHLGGPFCWMYIQQFVFSPLQLMDINCVLVFTLRSDANLNGLIHDLWQKHPMASLGNILWERNLWAIRCIHFQLYKVLLNWLPKELICLTILPSW